MSANLDAAVAALQAKIGETAVDGRYKFAIQGEGTILVADGKVAAEDGPADVTISGSMDTFRELLEGELSPAAAFMTGRIEVEGDMDTAMKLNSLFE